jgi:hypothetical protein
MSVKSLKQSSETLKFSEHPPRLRMRDLQITSRLRPRAAKPNTSIITRERNDPSHRGSSPSRRQFVPGSACFRPFYRFHSASTGKAQPGRFSCGHARVVGRNCRLRGRHFASPRRSTIPPKAGGAEEIMRMSALLLFAYTTHRQQGHLSSQCHSCFRRHSL